MIYLRDLIIYQLVNPFVAFYYNLKTFICLFKFCNGKLQCFTGFSVIHAMNNLFYRTQSINLNIHGRCGISKNIGDGNYELSNWWHIPLLSHSFFSNYPVLFNILSYLLYLIFSISLLVQTYDNNLNLYLFVLVFLLPLFSISIYKNLLYAQNYNSISLVFVLFAFYFQIQDSLLYSYFFFFLVSFLSITAFTIILPIEILYCLVFQNYEFLAYFLTLSLLPLLPLIYQLIYSRRFPSFKWILNAMGFLSITKSKTLKRRTLNISKISKLHVYWAINLLVSNILLIKLESDYFIFFLGTSIFWIINTKIIKICDPQHIYVLLSSILILAFTSLSEITLVILLIFILLLNPPVNENLNPYLINIQTLIDKISKFISNQSKSLFLCFPNPNGFYEDVFNQQRNLIEPFSYSANINNIHIFPDWWIVFKDSHFELPNFWVNSKSDLLQIAKDYNVEYFILTHSEQASYFDDDFLFIKSFDWKKSLTEYNLCLHDANKLSHCLHHWKLYKLKH